MSPPFGWSEREATNPYFFCHFCTLALEYQGEFDLNEVGTRLFCQSPQWRPRVPTGPSQLSGAGRLFSRAMHPFLDKNIVNQTVLLKEYL